MSTPRPTPIPTQTPPPHLERALNLLDGLLLREDLPLEARLELTRVFSDLLDVRPPYPPTVPDTRTADRPWVAVAADVVTAMQQLTRHPRPDAPPAALLSYAVAARELRDTINTADTTFPGRRTP